MKPEWIRGFAKEIEKVSFAKMLGGLLNLGSNVYGLSSIVPEYKDKAKLTNPLEPGGVADANSFQFAGSKGSSPDQQRPNFDLYK